MPSLNEPTAQLMEATKEKATGNALIIQEHVASFRASQWSMEIADKTLQLAEKSVKCLQPDQQGRSVVRSTYTSIGRTRRSIRALKRAGQRKHVQVLHVDQHADPALDGHHFTFPNVSTPASKQRVFADSERNCEFCLEDLDLSGYCSQDDPDFEPESDLDSFDYSYDSSDGEMDTANDLEPVDEPHGVFKLNTVCELEEAFTLHQEEELVDDDDTDV